MLLACDGDAQTADNGDAPMLTSYRAQSPPLIDKPPRAHWLRQLKLWRGNADDDDPSHGIAIDWSYVRSTSKEWITNPMNIALLLWLLCVAVSGAMLVLLLLGLLDGAFPTPASRNHWIEINNQVLNALFTLMSLYQHPVLCHHLFQLCRWRPADEAELRAAYCKDGAGLRHGERAHMAVVVALLHLTVACQYVLCGLYWGYTKKTRPELVENGLFVLGVVAPVIAVVYTVCSPLGKDNNCDLACPDAGSVTQHLTATGHAVVEPEWAGGMFDCGGDATAGWLSFSCTFCVFGWNMERLGFGSMFMHTATFVLLCFAPLWVLGVSALHIHDVVIGDTVGGAGALLCVCGLLYGGYWRIQMRERFGLPGSTACCGSESVTDYARWLFCWPFALAQEVRTASLYHIDGETFYKKISIDDAEEEERQPLLASHHVQFHASPDAMIATDGSSDHVVIVHEEVVPPAVQIVVEQVVEADKSEELSAVHHEKMGSPLPESVIVDDAELPSLSDGSWTVDKVKRLINVVTLVSLLILLYTRGFIR
ncbi:hypothetical protein E2562_004378 [Oryza meyeriana var. granulata]|uniref:Uncharacterized protein n=1 Tax=Oryza meyeriana var. granulata TaxID=110450 RepID=A0A6G1CZ41_9ORYZ|nr:hypothetical protein E2562_004378 [Oryza meyeriana var. granulata]